MFLDWIAQMEDSSSVNSYRIPGVSHTSASASGSVKSGYAPIEVHQVDGDDVNVAMAYVRSSSPVSNVSLSGDEVTPAGAAAAAAAALRRSARRTRFTVDRNVSDVNDASLEASDDHSQSATIMEHVRFDDHVSYIDRVAPPAAADVHTRPPHDVASPDYSHQQTETFTS